jgi:hypothetical protein
VPLWFNNNRLCVAFVIFVPLWFKRNPTTDYPPIYDIIPSAMLTSLLSHRERLLWLTGAALTLLWLLIYLTTVSPTVNFIDSGELITAVREPGIAHPPGYPLYVLLGFVASQVLWGDEAWRVNVFSAFWGAMAVGAFFILIYRLSEYILAPEYRSSTASARVRNRTSTAAKKLQANRSTQSSPKSEVVSPKPSESISENHPTLLMLLASAAGASLLAASSTFWSRTAQAKMYTLHFFFVALLLILALGFRRAYERNDPETATRWLIALAATLGLSFTNHLMTVILVIPIALMLLVGDSFMDRLRFILRRLTVAIPAFVIPLFLYLYMPIRAAQRPIMNWGSTDNLGDLYRHISGWQFRPYLLGNIGQSISQNSGLITRYISEQWGILTIFVLLGGLVAAALVYRARHAVFWPTFALFLLTFIFAMFYGISEIEPYMTMFYAMLAVWLGLAPTALLAVQRIYQRQREAYQRNSGSRTSAPQPKRETDLSYPWMVTATLGILVISSTILIYPKQNYSHNRLAEQFALNVFNELPQNSLIITDYWDFYAPTYYLQLVKGVRPDLTIIDKSLLRYPWYTTQLSARHPWLIEKSQDIVNTFAPEQRKWVNGEKYDAGVLQKAYFDLLTSFVERNVADHPAYLLTGVPCQPNQQGCEENLIAPTFQRIPAGLSDRLVAQNEPLPLPANEPNYLTDGITTNYVAFDDSARINSARYADAYARLAALYSTRGRTEAAERMNREAVSIENALKNR